MPSTSASASGPLRFLLRDRDRDGKYGHTFDAVFQADDLRVFRSAPRAPRMNAHCERVIGTIRRELLDHILITGEAHARQVLKTYEDHYNQHRPHQARDQLPPDVRQHPTAVDDLSTHTLLHTRISADSSTSTDMLLDQQRRLFERHTMPEVTRVATSQPLKLMPSR